MGPKGRSKVVTIQVLKCLDLKRPDQGVSSAFRTKEMQPFYFFQFYTFDEYVSPVMQGSNPNFDIRKQFECEQTEQFIDYMKSQVLKIDIIDESVDIAKSGNEAKDYVGSVRIPLKSLILGGGTTPEEIADCFPVKDA